MTSGTPEKPAPENVTPENATPENAEAPETPSSGKPEEIGGPKGAEPTRFGDWERNGRCSDF